MTTNQISQYNDGCSGGMSWFWRTFFKKAPPWEHCCDEHDKAYEAGIGKRINADRKLRECVKNNGHPIWAWLIYFAVRIGGVSWLPTRWRWNARI